MRKIFFCLTFLLLIALILFACSNSQASLITPVPEPPTSTPSPTTVPTVHMGEPTTTESELKWVVQKGILYIWRGQVPEKGTETQLQFVATDRFNGTPITPITGLSFYGEEIQPPFVLGVTFLFPEEADASFILNWLLNDQLALLVKPIVPPNCTPIIVPGPDGGDTKHYHFYQNEDYPYWWTVEYYYNCLPRGDELQANNPTKSIDKEKFKWTPHL